MTEDQRDSILFVAQQMIAAANSGENRFALERMLRVHASALQRIASPTDAERCWQAYQIARRNAGLPYHEADIRK